MPRDPPDSLEKGRDPPCKVVSGPIMFTVRAPQAKIYNIELFTSAQNVSGASQNVILNGFIHSKVQNFLGGPSARELFLPRGLGTPLGGDPP